MAGCLCPPSQITLVSQTTTFESTKDAELRRKAYKSIIELCENSLNRDVTHMAIQCGACSQCKTCKSIRQINTSSYNAYCEHVTMEELVKFTPGRNEEPGYFMSVLPIKPFNHGSVRGNKATAEMHNKSMVAKLQKDQTALEGVKRKGTN